MSESTPEQIMEAVTLLRSEVSSIEAKSLDTDVKERVLTVLDAHEEMNQKSLLAAKRSENLEAAIGEQKERIDQLTTDAQQTVTLRDEVKSLEALMAQRPGNHNDKSAYKDEAEYKALTAWSMRPDALSQEQKADMRTDVDTAGGFLAPSEFDAALQKEIVEIDAVRSLARVKTIAAKALEMAVRTDIPRALYEGEAEAAVEDISAYRLATVVPYRQTVVVPTTLDMLMNGAFDMESELVSDAGEGFAEGEGQGFVSGTGFKQPEGVTSNATVVANMAIGGNLSAVNTGDDTIFADAIIEITGKLKVGYNPAYNFHRRTLSRIRQLRDAVGGQFLWQPGLNGPVSNTLNGFPYILTPALDPWDTSTGDVMLFGDWARGYTIVDRTGLSIVRDEFTKANQAIIKFTLHRWNTGIVTIPEAFQMMRRN
jgi:HK97 family phage major capsid protein